MVLILSNMKNTEGPRMFKDIACRNGSTNPRSDVYLNTRNAWYCHVAGTLPQDAIHPLRSSCVLEQLDHETGVVVTLRRHEHSDQHCL